MRRDPDLPVAGERRVACPLCAGSGQRGYAAFPELEFVQCTRCGVVYKASERAGVRTETFYEEGYYTHKRNRRLKRFAHRQAKARRLIEMALEFVPARTVLDVGCAVGEVIAAACSLGLEGLGCDISQYAVDYCNSRGLKAARGELHALPAADHSIDLVVLKHVLEHSPEPRRALAEVKRVLSAKGGVLVAVPDLDYWKASWQRRGRYFSPRGLGRQHEVYYRAAHLRQLLESEGFKVHALTKAVFARRRAHGASAAVEAARFVGVSAWQAAARLLRMRREVVAVAALV